MSKDNIRIKGLADIRLRSDGEEIHLTFLTSHNKQLTIVISGEEMSNLSNQMFHFDSQARIKRNIPSDPNKPKIMMEAPPIFFTHDLQAIEYPETGAIDLQIQDVSKREIQVSFNPEHVKFLFDRLLALNNFDDDQSVN